MTAVSASADLKPISELLADGTAYLKSKGIEAPRLESEHLLASVLSCSRTDLFLHPNQGLNLEEGGRFWNHLSRRAVNEPLQYITGFVEFYGLALSIGPGAFIPRPETELIVETAQQIVPTPRRILDLCTGSGALALALARQFPEAKIFATDCSEAALSVARRNIDRYACAGRVSLLKGDLFNALSLEGRGGGSRPAEPFDLIVCNPPYISESERDALPPNVRDYEPALALFAPEDGRAYYRRILSEVDPFLSNQGKLLLELGAGQAEWLKGWVNEMDVFDLHLIDDWAGIQRIAQLTRRLG